MSETNSDDPGELPPITYVWQTPIRKPRRSPWDFPGNRGPKRLSSEARAKLERIVSRAPEVMVKITGRTKDVGHLKSHLEYITRNGELAAETEQGAVLAGRQGLRDLQERWTDDVTLDDRRRANATLSINMILSMPPGTDPIKVRDAVRAFATDTFEGRHDYVFVMHQDDEHPHVHLTVRSLGYNGRRLNPRKADLHHWRECFASELRLRGIAAEATPRRTRGKIRKADRGKLRAMKERGSVPRVERLAREEVVHEAVSGTKAERPWEEKIRARQQTIRQRYLELAAELVQSGDPRETALGHQVERFVRGMPGLATRRHDLRQELSAFAREMEQAKSRPTDQDGPDRDRDQDR